MVASSRGVVARKCPPERQTGKDAVQSTNNVTRVWLILPDSLSEPTPIQPPKILLHQRPGRGPPRLSQHVGKIDSGRCPLSADRL